MARTIDYCYVSLYRGTLSLRLWRRLTMVFCETSVTEDTTNELWWRFYANNSSFLRELLLRIVFQDWFVDDGNFYPTCGNYDLLFWWKIAKNYFKCVFKVILLVSECRSLCKNFWDQIPRHEFWTWRKSPLLNSYIGHQNPFQLPIVPSCYYHQPLQTQPLLGPNLQSNQYLSLILELYKSPSVLLFWRLLKSPVCFRERRNVVCVNVSPSFINSTSKVWVERSVFRRGLKMMEDTGEDVLRQKPNIVVTFFRRLGQVRTLTLPAWAA